MSQPYTYSNAIRVHDESVYKWIDTLLVDYEDDPGPPPLSRKARPIIHVFASPDRAFAKVADLLIRQNWFANQPNAAAMLTAAETDITAVLPLPIVSIQASDPVYDPELASACKIGRRTVDPLTGRIVSYPWPGHYRRSYALTFWSNKVYTEAFMREWLMGQLGNLGASNDEMFLKVYHPLPWGMFYQSFKFEGSQDQSVYEGNDPRYRRFVFNMSLRFWLMKLPYPSQPHVDTVLPPAVIEGNIASGVTQPLLAAPFEAGQPLIPAETGNLFHQTFPTFKVPVLWPKTGNAQVGLGTINPIRSHEPFSPTMAFSVATTDDSGDFGEWFTYLETAGYSIFNVSFDYLSPSNAVVFEASQRSNTTNPDGTLSALRSIVLSVNLPLCAQWKKFQRYIAITNKIVAFTIGGVIPVPSGSSSSNSSSSGSSSGSSGGLNLPVYPSWFANIFIRRVFATPRIATASQSAGVATWNGLPQSPYLGVALLTQPPPSGAAPDTVYLDSDAFGSASFTRQTVIDPTINAGAVLLIQPDTQSLRMRWDAVKTFPSSLWVQSYAGAFLGSDV